MRRRFRRGLGSARLLALLAVAGPIACSESRTTTNAGDNLIDDTRDQPRPPENPDPPADSAVPDAPIYDAAAGYKPTSACAGCACSPDAHFCFGGGTPKGLAPAIADGGDTTDSGKASADGGDGGDSGLAACPLPASAATIQIGCNDLPAACASDPTCACILQAIQPKYACYLVCQDADGQLLAYCPSP